MNSRALSWKNPAHRMTFQELLDYLGLENQAWVKRVGISNFQSHTWRLGKEPVPSVYIGRLANSLGQSDSYITSCWQHTYKLAESGRLTYRGYGEGEDSPVYTQPRQLALVLIRSKGIKTPSQLFKVAHISPPTSYAFINGDKFVSLGVAKKISRSLGVSALDVRRCSCFTSTLACQGLLEKGRLILSR